ncbi:MAG: c-type cytochrome [Ferruginibacter sp.]
MTVKFITYFAGITFLVLIIGSVIFYRSLPGYNYDSLKKGVNETTWQPPDTIKLGFKTSDNLIRYGRSLIANTAAWLGPQGAVAHISNGMNCQNCHLEAGTRLYGSNFASVATAYPKFRERSGRVESIAFRINECLERSLNGQKLDSGSKEMTAMVAYIKWVGKDVVKSKKLKGIGVQEMPLLSRAANPENGRQIYTSKCTSCHGAQGQGLTSPDTLGFTYPPLWGNKSYNVSAGMYRISRLAAYVKYNMPFQPVRTEPQLSDEEAWDVAAFINAQDRPKKTFAYDWPNIKTKPVDYPFGPYADNFSEVQHKFGPFEEIKKAKSLLQKKPQ